MTDSGAVCFWHQYALQQSCSCLACIPFIISALRWHDHASELWMKSERSVAVVGWLEGSSLGHIDVGGLGVRQHSELGSKLGQMESGHLQTSDL